MDTFDSCVVAAADYEAARLTHPNRHSVWDGSKWIHAGEDYSPEWASPAQVECKLIGVAIEGTRAGVILASFRAS